MIVKTPTRRAPVDTKRVGIYCRQSVSDPNDEFGSVVAQREQVELFVQSQRQLGWAVVKTLYNDTNASGGDTDRPALQQVLKDIKDGRIDVLCVYKIDRLSRSLLDFTQLLRFLDKHQVPFVSTTQQFNTATSVGRLVVNILATFAQFERETISERTRDKMQASRRRGQWTGGFQLLGYDATDSKLVVNPEEADQVRAIFDLYLTEGSLLAVVHELDRRDWKTKSWVNKAGKRVGGKPYEKNQVRRLLTNPWYLGKSRLGDETFPGEHAAIVDEALFDRAGQQLRSHHHEYRLRNKWESPLKGLVKCGRCGKPMTHIRQAQEGRQYFYYKCQTLQRRGRDACPNAEITAHELEDSVIAAVRKAVDTEEFLEKVYDAAEAQRREGRPELQLELQNLDREKRRLTDSRSRLMDAVETGTMPPGALTARLAEIDRQLLAANENVESLMNERDAAEGAPVDKEAIRKALTSWVPLWDELFPAERKRILTLLVERVVYDPETEKAEVQFRMQPPDPAALAS